MYEHSSYVAVSLGRDEIKGFFCTFKSHILKNSAATCMEFLFFLFQFYN